MNRVGRRNAVLGTLVLLAACASDPEAPGARPGGACSDAASVTRTGLEAGGVLCEHQTLVAPLHPGDALEVSFRVFTPGDVDLCFDDDDQEPHEVSLRGTTVVAQTPCRTVSLAAGDHVLGLRHALREAGGGQDARPDVLHTKWTAPTSASRGRLQVTSNACRGCKLDGPWPELGAGSYGYAGDYTDAIIDGPCKYGESTCQLGDDQIPSSFDRAQILIRRGSNDHNIILGNIDRHSPADTFRGARLTALDRVQVVGVDATGAKFLGNDLIYSSDTNLTGVDLTEYRFGGVFEGCRMDVATYLTAVGNGAGIYGGTVTVPKGQSLAGVSLDGNLNSRPLSFVWPVDERGILTMAGASFEKATLRNLTIPCPHGGDLRGASFAGATLENVSVTGCDLTDARFAGSTLTNVVAASRTSLVRADLTNVKVKGLDVSDASLSDATLANAPNSPWTGLVARHLTAASLHAHDLVVLLDGSGRGADFTSAVLSTADFARAQLPRARFTGAVLTTTDFSSATLVGADFQSATGIGPSFDSAHLEPSSASRTSMNAARFVAPKFHNAYLQGTKLTFARVCGGDFGGARLEGVDLTGTLMPPVSDRFMKIGEDTFDCPEIKDLATVVNDATTVCPDGTPGPCSGAAWVPSSFVPQCPANLPRKKSGFSCTTACDCTLLTCLNGTCG